jgi:hypothetical protein
MLDVRWVDGVGDAVRVDVDPGRGGGGGRGRVHRLAVE